MALEETKETTTNPSEETKEENTTPKEETKEPESGETTEDKGEDTKDDENKEEENKDINPEDVDLENPNEVSQALDKKGLVYNDFVEEYMTTGKISETSVEKLAAVGIPKEMIDGYIKGYEARVELEQNELASVVGGKENLEAIKNWAATNLNREEIISLNEIRNKEELKLVLIGLKASMEDKEGKTPEYQKGSGDKTAMAGYRSQAEMFEAIKNPKYKLDPAYRQDVQKKITASREAGIDLGIY